MLAAFGSISSCGCLVDYVSVSRAFDLALGKNQSTGPNCRLAEDENL